MQTWTSPEEVVRWWLQRTQLHRWQELHLAQELAFKVGWIPPAGTVAPQALATADLARKSQVAVVVVRDYAGEAGDKPSLRLPNGQADLIRQVAAANPSTIVVLNANGAVQTSDWDSGVPAILLAAAGLCQAVRRPLHRRREPSQMNAGVPA